MRLRDLLLFLVGDRKAIRRCARDRRALWLGLFFVLLAAVARDYDHEFFPAEPWHLVIPAGASLALAFVLFGILWLLAKPAKVPFWSCLGQFVALFWLTGPLAWCYAIPFERLMPLDAAVRANLWLLLLVAAWRVVLITRVASVLFRVPPGKVVAPVLWVCDTLAIVAMQFLPFPIIAVMGGVPRDFEALHGISCFVLGLGVVLWPAFAWKTLGDMSHASVWRRPPTLRPSRLRWGPWLLGLVVLLAGSVPIYDAQLQQRERVVFVDALRAEDWDAVAEALRDPAAMLRRPDANRWLEELQSLSDRSARLPDFFDYLRDRENRLPSHIDHRTVWRLLHR